MEVSGFGKDSLGIMVWWTLEGHVDHGELLASLHRNRVPPKWAPKPPSRVLVARRATTATIGRQNRTLLRPLATRSTHDVMTERVLTDDKGEAVLTYAPRVRVQVDESGKVEVMPSTSADVGLANDIAQAVPEFEDRLVAADMSQWLLSVLDHRCYGCALRSKGGLYFIPKGGALRLWRRVMKAVVEVSPYEFFTVPVSRSPEAVDVLLHGVVTDAERAFTSCERYLNARAGYTNRSLTSHLLGVHRAKEKLKVFRAALETKALDEPVRRSLSILAGISRYRAMVGVKPG